MKPNRKTRLKGTTAIPWSPGECGRQPCWPSLQTIRSHRAHTAGQGSRKESSPCVKGKNFNAENIPLILWNQFRTKFIVAVLGNLQLKSAILALKIFGGEDVSSVVRLDIAFLIFLISEYGIHLSFHDFLENTLKTFFQEIIDVSNAGDVILWDNPSGLFLCQGHKKCSLLIKIYIPYFSNIYHLLYLHTHPFSWKWKTICHIKSRNSCSIHIYYLRKVPILTFYSFCP